MNRLLELARQLVAALSGDIVRYLDIEILLDEIDKELERETGRRREKEEAMSKFYKPPPPKEWELPPAETLPGVCVDVVDMGWQEIDYGRGPEWKPQVRFVWELDEEMTGENDPEMKGKRFLVSQSYTMSLYAGKANLSKMLSSWLKLDAKEIEAKGYDFDLPVGQAALLGISHHTSKKGKTYSRVDTVLALPKNTKAAGPSGDYTRVEKRDGYEAPDYSSFGPGPEIEEDTTVNDSDLPF